MPLYRYKAYSPQGKKIIGVIDADSLTAAKDKLRKQSLMVTVLDSAGLSSKETVLGQAALFNFTRELAQLLKAGLPLYESLSTIEEKYRGMKAHPLFLDLCDSLKNGASLSLALKKYPQSFNSIYLSLISAGEETASLPEVLEQLAFLISRQQKLKKQLFSALAYPCFLGVFCLLVVSGLFFFVIPSMQELFEGRQLHPLTQGVLAISQWLNAHGKMLLLCISTAGFAFYLFLKRPDVRLRLQKMILKIPLCKSLILHSGLVRFCRTVSLLLSGGLPLIEALALSRNALKHPILEEVISGAEKKIVEGEKLSARLKQSSLIPSLVPRMIAIAEEAGNMEQMMKNIAEIYEEDLEKSLAQLTTFLQPALLVFLGGVVGLVVLSILLPLTDVSSFLAT